MANWKLTMIMQATTLGDVQRIGGWSESVYWDNMNSTVVRDFLTLCQKRAALLGAQGAVVGQRYQQVNPVGGSSTGGNIFPSPWPAGNIPGTGSTAGSSDLPQVALLCKARASGAANIRNVIIRGLPDDVVFQGRYSPWPAYNTALQDYFRELAGWQFRAHDLTQQRLPITSIDGAGVMILSQPATFAVNDVVSVQRTQGGSKPGGNFAVATVTSSTQFTLRGWNLGEVTGGQAQKFVVTYPIIVANGITLSRAIVRKVGRPFFAWRGRRSKRRKTPVAP